MRQGLTIANASNPHPRCFSYGLDFRSPQDQVTQSGEPSPPYGVLSSRVDWSQLARVMLASELWSRQGMDSAVGDTIEWHLTPRFMVY